MMIRILATVWFVSASCFAFAQNSPNTAYAITSKTYGAHEWTEVKEINLVNGEVIRNVFENTSQYNVMDGRTAKAITAPATTDSSKENKYHPFYGLSAACAYDDKLKRLYYAPMFVNQLRYIDLNSSVPTVYLFHNEKLSNAKDVEEEASQITRMVIASDGNGYALTNDGRHLVKFTTDKMPVITDLGELNNAPENGEFSIHESNTSWGGDMLADAAGNLYVISAFNHVFKIDVATRVATYVTKIGGLPVSFTTNGAVVNEEGNIVVSSANFLTSYFTVDPHSWQATSVEPREQVYNTSDLANQNLLYKTRFNKEEKVELKEQISVYPNPVKSRMFRVSFENKASGRYNIQMVDVTGRMISDRVVSVYTGSQVNEVRVDQSLSKGMYFVKVLNHQHKEVFTKKVIIE